MPDQTDTTTPEKTAVAKALAEVLTPTNLIKLPALIGTLVSAGWALSGKLAVSEAKLQDHGERLGKIESDLQRKTIRDARSDQKLDDLINTLTEVKAGVDQLNQRDNARRGNR